MRRLQPRRQGWFVLLGVFLAACANAEAPTLVASFPLRSSTDNSSRGVAGNPVVVETIFLTLEVDSPDRAADQAERLAVGYGGYETNRYAWNSDGGRTVSQEIFVPLDRADSLHMHLLQMGRKIQESVVIIISPCIPIRISLIRHNRSGRDLCKRTVLIVPE